MPLNISEMPYDMGPSVKAFEQPMLEALGACRDALAAGGAAVQAKLILWFGDGAAPLCKDTREKIAKMRSLLAARDIPVKSAKRAGFNADTGYLEHGMYTPADRRSAGDSTDIRMRSSNIEIVIGGAFKLLPSYAVGIPSAWTNQDKFETLLHELSHIVLGTEDCTCDDGKYAYWAQRARLLAVQSPARAKINAENWGFFIEEFRVGRAFHGPPSPPKELRNL